MFNGIEVVIDEPKITPVFQLSEEVSVSPAFRERSNALYLQLFGTREHRVVPKNEAYWIGARRRRLFASPEFWAAMQQRMKERSDQNWRKVA